MLDVALLLSVISFLLLAARSAPAELYTWWVDPCTKEAAQATGCQPGDTELGAWAFEAWQRESNGAIIIVRRVPTEAHARIRIRWACGAWGFTAKHKPVDVDGKQGAVIYVLPDTEARPDRLLRDAIVYLTCLHESGHALGLKHTAHFADIMYSFQYGGDLVEYFDRYRRLLENPSGYPRSLRHFRRRPRRAQEPVSLNANRAWQSLPCGAGASAPPPGFCPASP